MQISATVIAAQQAAREAQARFQANHVAPAASFSAALETQDFAPLPLKQTAGSAPATAAADAAPASRPGSLLDIKV